MQFQLSSILHFHYFYRSTLSLCCGDKKFCLRAQAAFQFTKQTPPTAKFLVTHCETSRLGMTALNSINVQANCKGICFTLTEYISHLSLCITVSIHACWRCYCLSSLLLQNTNCHVTGFWLFWAQRKYEFGGPTHTHFWIKDRDEEYIHTGLWVTKFGTQLAFRVPPNGDAPWSSLNTDRLMPCLSTCTNTL